MSDPPKAKPVCGYTSHEIRDILCRIGDEIWPPRDFASRLMLPPREGAELAQALLAQGYVEPTKGWRADIGRPSGLELTPLGRRLTRQSRLRPISRECAAAIIGEIPARIDDANSRSAFMHRIVDAHVVGSWCRGDDEVSVVDVAVRLVLKGDLAQRTKGITDPDDTAAQLLVRWLLASVSDVLSLVKRRTPHLRVYDYRRSSSLGSWTERIYPPTEG
ncbi:hypothetical protein [Rhodoplanes roseus]|uniref:Uncharacterized protein n=1 Tax=Rhodoplanes roseus TaxID=29409 RepID=A0A327L7B8_9BRAD|nr:hypothetical protein [Rhodoplanes roseus]RAI45945.1 hypothetical protein CH341_01130 [Rhodoplanes roseus]